jgi:16S rRNA (guanine527-N7)-methyltransferase
MAESRAVEPKHEHIAQLLCQLWPEASQSEATVRGLRAWLELLVAWNQKIDLTAARTSEELVDLFLADAAVLHRARGELASDGSWLDVGSGAGAPGLGMAIFDSSLSMTLVEPNAKRVAFLRQVVGRLQLTRVRVRCARAESLEASAAEEVVARATWSPSEWLEQGTRLTRHRVWILLAREAWEPPDGYRLEYSREYQWPLTGVPRRVVAVAAHQPQSER